MLPHGVARRLAEQNVRESCIAVELAATLTPPDQGHDLIEKPIRLGSARRPIEQRGESMAAVVEYFESGNFLRNTVLVWRESGTVLRPGVFRVTRCVVKDSFLDQAPELPLARDPDGASLQYAVAGLGNVQ